MAIDYTNEDLKNLKNALVSALSAIEIDVENVKIESDHIELDVEGIQNLIGALVAPDPASTNGLLTTIDGVLDDIKVNTDALIADPATETTQLLVKGVLDAIQIGTDKIPASPAQEAGNLKTVADYVSGDSGKKVPIDNANLDAKLSDIKTGTDYLDDIKAKTDNLDTALSGIKSKTDNLDTALSGIKTGTDKIPASPATTGKQDEIMVAMNNQIATKVSGVTDPTAVFADSASANDQQTITISAPNPIRKRHRIIVHNPSTVTDITVKVFNKIDIGAGALHHYMGSFVVNAKATVTGTSIETDGRNVFDDLWLAGADIDLIVSNNSPLGGSDGFTATVQIYAVNNL